MLAAKRMGFSDVQIGTLADRLPEQVRQMRHDWNITPVYKMVDTCAAEFDAATPYFYSTYEHENEAMPSPVKKAVVIGSGPIRIGQGIEFDYCSRAFRVGAAKGRLQSIMINSNPETVSTDFDTSRPAVFRSPGPGKPARYPGKRGQRREHASTALHRPVRRADGHQSGGAAAAQRPAAHRLQRRDTSTWPRTAAASRISWQDWAYRSLPAPPSPMWKKR